jgi:predicted RNase H-like HicB family nuclease
LVEAGGRTQAYGIRFPDLPAVFSAADEETDVMSNAIEALQLWAEDEELPEPTTAAKLVRRSDVRQALASGCYLMAVPLIENDTAVVGRTI